VKAVTDAGGAISYRSCQCSAEVIGTMTGSSEWLLVYSILVLLGGMCATQILL
jgi:hypothetical protein